MAPIRTVIPTASDEIFTANSLLELPNRRWAYIESNLDPSGQLRPGYVMNASGLRGFLQGRTTARHPIDNQRSYRQQNIRLVPPPIIAAYRSAMAAGPPRARSRSRSPPPRSVRARSLSPNVLEQLAVMESLQRRSRSRSRSLSVNTLAQIAAMNRRSQSLSPNTAYQIALMESMPRPRRRRR